MLDDIAKEYITRCKELTVLDLSANEGISLDAFSKLKKLKKIANSGFSGHEIR